MGRGRGEGVGGEETACWRPINLEAMRGQEKGEMVGKRRGEGEREKKVDKRRTRRITSQVRGKRRDVEEEGDQGLRNHH